jgi:hypothetical protein
VNKKSPVTMGVTAFVAVIERKEPANEELSGGLISKPFI